MESILHILNACNGYTYFISYNDNPQKVVDQALHFDKSVLRFLTWMLGASYGSNWIPQEWLKFSPNITNLIEKLI